MKEFLKVEDKQHQNQNNFLKKDQIENSTSEPEQIVNTVTASLPLEMHMSKDRKLYCKKRVIETPEELSKKCVNMGVWGENRKDSRTPRVNEWNNFSAI